MNAKRVIRVSLLAILVCLALAWTLVGYSTATISTDKQHYSVGAMMTINGSGFSSSVLIKLEVQTPDHTTVLVPGVNTDTNGNFTTTYTPTSLTPGRYTFTATDGANSATTATTQADAIGFSKGVYNKADTTYAGGATGKWTTGDAGSEYLENQWAFYQYQATGLTTAIPDFDVQYNYHQASSHAIFLDAFANMRACVTAYNGNNQLAGDVCENVDSNGLLSDGHPFPTTSTTNWINAFGAISNVNHPLAADGSCSATPDPRNSITDDHCFHVNGTTLKALLVAAHPLAFTVPTADSYSVTLYYASHLAATAVWNPFNSPIGNEALLGCSSSSANFAIHVTPSPNFVGEGSEFIPTNTVYGTDVYNFDGDPCTTNTLLDWTQKFPGIGTATGSSRHFQLANPMINGQSVGSQGAITLPIPSVAAPTGVITIIKVTNPANSGADSFPFSGDLGSFILDTNGADATHSNTFTQVGLPGGQSYTVNEGTEPAGWAAAGTVSCINNTGISSFTGVTASGVTINLIDTANASVTCTFTNAKPDANITITPLLATNAVGNAHTFTITMTAIPNGVSPVSLTSIIPSVTPAPTSQSDTCAAAAFVANVATCTLTINSTTTGTFTAHAVGTASIGGATLIRATGDGKTGDSADAVKHYVGGTIAITPSATNEVGHAHTFTVTVTQDPDGGTAATTANVSFTVTPAPTSQSSTCSATTPFSGNTATCTITINNSSVGSFTAHASASYVIGGVTVTRATDGTNGNSGDAVKKYVDGSITITPTAVNEVNHAHTFTITATQVPGTATAATTANITPSVSPTPTGSTSTTCSSAVAFSGNTATCTFTINNPVAGFFTASASGVFTVGGVTLTRATNDGAHGDGANATKTYVDAKIVLSPLTATNPVNAVHTITATVSQNDGLAAGATGGDATTGFGAAPNGTLVTFSLLNNTPTPPIAFVGGVNTCTTTGGTCSVQINSTVAGGVDIHATTTFSVLGVSLTRASGDGLSGDSANAHKDYVAGTIIIRKVTQPAGGTGFGYTTTGGLSPATFSLNDAGNRTYSNQAPGSFSVTETLPVTGYDLTNITCTAGSNTSGNSATPNTTTGAIAITLAAGGVVDCTYTNTKQGSIVVDKTSVGSTGSFTYTATGAGMSGFGLTTATAGVASTPKTFSNLSAGAASVARSVTETGPGTGFQFTSLVCSSALGTSTFTPSTLQSLTQVASISVLGAGDTVTCHYVNTGEGSIVVRKETIGATGGFTWTTTGNGLSGFTGSTVNKGDLETMHTFSNLFTGATGGSRTITESDPGATWVQTSAACTSGSGNSTVSGTTISNLAPGDTVTCDFVNTKQANLVVTKTTIGSFGAFNYTGSTSFTLTTTAAGAGGKAATNSATVPSFTNIVPGTIKTVNESAKTGWVLDGAPTCTTTSTTGSGTSSSVISASGAMVTLGAGDTVTCNFVNDALPTLTIIKHATGSSATFSYDVTGANSLSAPATNLTPPANGSAQFGPVTITPGASSVSEHSPLPTGWTLTDSSCTINGLPITGSNPEVGTGADYTFGFTAGFGDNVVCNYTNSIVILTTRTQGFWATHTGLSDAVWNGGPLPPGFPSGGFVLGADQSPTGSPDAYLCGVEITAVPTNEENILMGGFWANISQKSGKGGKRASIDQSRMQMLQQYLAAVLNVHMFGSGSEAMLSTARAAYCGTNQTLIQNQIGILGTFNQSGDNQAFDPLTNGTPTLSKAYADIDAWDTPQYPGLSDEDGAPKLALTKLLNQGLSGTAATTDFTLHANCAAGPCTGTNLMGAGLVSSTNIIEGTYTLSETANANGAGYTPGQWTCTGGTVGPTSAGGTATLSVTQGAVVSCSITNTHP